MDFFHYLIIGGGMTAAAAALGIRENDPTGSIAILSDESHRPYDRPDLSKKLWTGKSEDKIWRKLPAEGLTLRLGDAAAVIEPSRKQVTTASGAKMETIKGQRVTKYLSERLGLNLFASKPAV